MSSWILKCEGQKAITVFSFGQKDVWEKDKKEKHLLIKNQMISLTINLIRWTHQLTITVNFQLIGKLYQCLENKANN